MKNGEWEKAGEEGFYDKYPLPKAPADYQIIWFWATFAENEC